MRSLIIVIVAVLFLSVSLGITALRTNNSNGEAGRQLASFDFSREHMLAWFCEGKEETGDCVGAMHFPEIGTHFVLRAMQTLHDVLNDRERFPALPTPLNLIQTGVRPETIQDGIALLTPIHDAHTAGVGEAPLHEYKYWGFFPVQDAIILPGGPAVSYSTPCFTNVTAQAIVVNSSTLRVDIMTSGHKGLLCTDAVHLSGAGSVVGEISGDGTTNLMMNTTAIKGNAARKWLLDTRGIVVGRQDGGHLRAILDLIATVVLISGFSKPTLKGAVFKASTDFYGDYVQFNPNRMGEKISIRKEDTKHKGKNFVAQNINTTNIKSGDTFMIVRPDGLDPTIAWTLGTSVGHTTMALWAPNRTLFVCESTTKDAYWPTQGVQCNPWTTWWQNAHAAQFNVVMLPLASPKEFDEAAAWDFFYANQGLAYGYSVFLSGWLDMKHGRENSMCIPPNFEACLTRNLMEITLVSVDELLGNNPENMVRQAFAHRVGLWPQQVTAAESIMHGQLHLGMETLSDLYSVVEQDTWRYNTTRYGQPVTDRSMICNVFVCHMLKAGGMFKSIGDEIQCGESNLWTIYSSKIWDEGRMGDHRPKICRDADPSNPLCQMMGEWTLTLHPDLNSRPIYANMSNHCPSMGPDYVYPDNC